MSRILACAIVTLLFVGGSFAADKAKNQMVKGTIKSVEPGKDLLVVNQKLDNETVERQLSITKTTEFIVTIDGKTETSYGREGLNLIFGKEGATVAVKCDKDVNVLSVKVTIKK
jgi:hypothetical protein